MTLNEIQPSALNKASTRPFAGKIARSMLVLILLLLIFLLLTPWQQNVRGYGRVVAFTPFERQQFIGAPVEGRIAQWHVTEGTRVKKDQVLADMLDNDPLLVQRIEAEKNVVLERQAAVVRRVQTVQAQLRMAELARPQALSAADSRVLMARERFKAAQQALVASNAAQKTSALNLVRQQRLFSKGLASKRTFELAELENAQRETERERAKASLQAANSEVDALSADAGKLGNDTLSTIEKSRADLNKAIEEQNYVKAELLKLETRLARQMTQTIVSPRDGTVLRLLTSPGAELIKAGQALVILVPDTQERAVELWIDGNDLPLIVVNSHVRLQFEGYPAVQFGGWPEFSIGSFGGQVALIDSTDDGKGHFRILISPDKHDIAWPEPRFLRQGVRVNGWVLLGQVTLGYELWRIFNGFPPLVLPEPAAAEKVKDDKSSAKEDKKNDAY
ncbi:MAG: HlyD family efflux transporter periplasmic adaptor subunit [Methylococcales bacterium]|nr:HlyD family efflux transporter periplasmic adaptor subunit [Methylococcales bacterium]